MNYIICALAVYKALQIIESLLPKEVMPWVKVVAGTVLSYIVIFIIPFDDRWLSGLAVATLAGAVHTLLRLLTLMGDMSFKRSIK
jgi:uncharacterized membrane protein